jgi:hypothetical protein
VASSTLRCWCCSKSGTSSERTGLEPLGADVAGGLPGHQQRPLEVRAVVPGPCHAPTHRHSPTAPEHRDRVLALVAGGQAEGVEHRGASPPSASVPSRSQLRSQLIAIPDPHGVPRRAPGRMASVRIAGDGTMGSMVRFWVRKYGLLTREGTPAIFREADMQIPNNGLSSTRVAPRLGAGCHGSGSLLAPNPASAVARQSPSGTRVIAQALADGEYRP